MDYLINAYDYYRPGGSIMLILIVISFWMWGMILERLLAFDRMERRDIDMDAAAAMHARPAARLSDSGICFQVVQEFMRNRTGDNDLDGHILEQCAMRRQQQIRRFLPAITVLAASAPLFGLLGTVTGMISTFDVIAIFGSGNAKALAGGISKALITTQSGLLVGIPGLFMGSLLNRRAHIIERRLMKTVMSLKRGV